MVELIEGAAREHLDYHRVLRLVCSGQVRGERRLRRWYVCPEDLRRWKRENMEQREPSPAA
jgi:hypothetical protein